MPDCLCLTELYWVQHLLCVREEGEGRGWKVAGRAPTDVWRDIKIRWLKLLSFFLSFDGNIRFTQKLTSELPVLRLAEEMPSLWSWQITQAPHLKQFYLQHEYKPDAGQGMEVISDSKYPCFCHVYTCDRGICVCII